MQTVILVIHLIIALALIGVVMLQRSEGGALGMGGGGGGGGAGSLFSARGVGNVLTRTTAYLAVGFFATSIALTMLASKNSGGSIFDRTPATQTQPAGQTAPAESSGSGGSVLPQLPAAPAAPATP